jgi:hypothetical protein
MEEFPKWKLIAKYKGEFPCHFTCVYIHNGCSGRPPIENAWVGSWFLMGGMANNCIQFIDKNIFHRAPMLQEKSFFAAVSILGTKIYTFGGYENIEKVQLKTCEVYDCETDKWSAN